MAKELNEYQVRLTFDANTDKAKKQLKDLQQQLQSLATGSGTNKLNFSDEIAKASKAAAELSAHLSQATNMKTGTLDFTKLNDSIKKSGQSLADYGEQLLKLGPSGQQAFQKLATAVSNSEIPVRRISNTLREMGTVLKNTIKWQISSSAIHSFMGAVQSAYGYAQDLNESLNNIRIVTGQNIEQMERFAVTANKAAKALSASTLDYTDAALIYYQQGLSDEEVKARTDVTVKMANVTGETAEKVSQQLTAVWNNFAKGTDNLEYFADVMTALGAATASSTDEISAGLEKFSTVAETVGLSYEYATAALATVTATTRQSADVVGNAFKTIFARLEGLKLGETLEDGTDLNKYSAALHNVGVEIKNTDGSLKDMDTILDELSGRWQTLSRDQQMALAQTVAGVRQYNTLISLMNKWDFMQKNLETARNASGTLQEQANIYAESWEAAQKRVKAAAESVYQSLIDDKFFITLLDGTEKVITGINNLIKAIGGLPGVLSVVATVFTNLFEKQMVQGLQNLTYTLQNLTEKGRMKNATRKEMALNEMLGVTQNADYQTFSEQVNAETLREEVKLKAELIEASKNLNEIEVMASKTLLEQVGNLEEAKRKQAEELELVKQKQAVLNEDISGFVYERYAQGNINKQQLAENLKDIEVAKKTIIEIENLASETSNKINNLNQQLSDGVVSEKEYINQAKQIYGAAAGSLDSSLTGTKNLSHSFSQLKANSTNLTRSAQIAKDNLEVLNGVIKETRKLAEQKINIAAGQDGKDGRDLGSEYTASLEAINQASQKYEQTVKNLQQSADQYHKSLISGQANLYTWQQGIVQGTQVLSGLSMTINQFKGIISTLGDSDLSFFDKFLSVSMSLGMAVPNLLKGFSNAKELFNGISTSIQNLTLNYALQEAGVDAITAKTEAFNLVKGMSYKLGEAENSLIVEELVGKAALAKGLDKATVAQVLNNAAKEKGAALTPQEIVTTLASAQTKGLETTALWANTKAWIANHAAMLGIVAAIGLVVAGIILLIKHLSDNTPEKKLERAKEAADKFKESIKETTEEFQNLYNTIADYSKAREALADLTAGTQEFVDAVKSGNEAAQNLIDDLGLIFGTHYVFDDNGLVAFLEAGQSKIQEAQERAKLFERASSYVAVSKDQTTASREYIASQRQANAIPSSATNIWSQYETVANSEVLKNIKGGENLQSAEAISELLQEIQLRNITDIGMFLGEKGLDTTSTYFSEIKDTVSYLNSLGSAVAQIPASLTEYTNQWGQLTANILMTSGLNSNSLATAIANKDFITDIQVQAALGDRKNGTVEEEADAYKQLVTMGFTRDQIQQIYNENDIIGTSAVRLLNYINYIEERRKQLQDQVSKVENMLQGSENQALFANLLTGNLQNVSEEDFKRLVNGEFKTSSLLKTAFKAMFPEGDYDEFLSDIENNWNIADYYRAQIKDFSVLQEEIKNLNKAFGSLKTGDIVDSLEGLSDEAKSYFALMADGTYQLVGSAKEFQEVLLNDQRQKLIANIDNARNAQNAAAENITSAQFSVEDFTQEASSIDEFDYEGLAQYNKILEENIAIKQEAAGQERLNQYTLAMTATSVEDLNGILETGKITLDDYAAAWAVLEQKKDLEGLDTKELEEFSEYLQETADLTEEEAEIVARSTMKMNKGLDSLTKSFASWSDILKTEEKNSQKYFSTLTNLRSAIADLLDISGEHLSDTFLTSADNMALMQRAAEGDKTAIDELRNALADDLFQNYVLLNPEVTGKEFADIEAQYDAFRQYIEENTPGASLDTSGFIDSLNEMIRAEAITIDQANAMLDSMGVQATYEAQEVPLPRTATTVTKHIRKTNEEAFEENGVSGLEYDLEETTEQHTVPLEDQKQSVFAVAYNSSGTQGKKPQITGVVKKATSTSSSYTPPSTGKGGGSKSSQKKRNSDVERYHEIKSTIKDLTTEYDRLNKARDRLYGKDKLDYIGKEIDQTKKLVDANKEYIAQIKGWQEIDLERANAVAKQFGFEEFDDQANWTDIQFKLNDYYNTKVLNSDDETLKEGYEQWVKYIQQVIDTHDLLNEKIDETQELMNRVQDLTFEEYTYTIEIRLDLKEKEKRIIESKLNTLGDNIYKKAEAAALMLNEIDGSFNPQSGGLNLLETRNNYTILKGQLEEAQELLRNDQISGEQAKEAYDKVFDSALETADELVSMNDTFRTYYREVLDEIKEEMSYLEKGFSTIFDELGHYQKMLDLTGQAKIYDKQLAILRTQLDVTKEQFYTHQMQAARAQQDYDEMQAQYNAMDALQQAQYQDQLRAAKDYLDELNSSVRQDIESLADYAKQILITSTEQIYQAYEDNLTNGAGFDYLSQIMDLASEKAELVLTETNQQYEANKMIRDLNRDIEKTNNQAAKTRISNFKQEIEGLKTKGELTHYELEDAQLRYEVLKAQIALEEAQNTATTVRLQRDNEGNFGYVYTADQDVISKAQDDLDSAQNNRYNHALEAQEKFQRQYYQTEKSFQEDLQALQEQRLAGEIDEETYQKRVLETKNFYLPILKTLEQNNLDALEDMNETSTSHINDSWTRMFNESGYGLKGKTEEWEDFTIDAISDVDEKFREWQNTLSEFVEPEVTSSLTNLKEKTNELKTAAEELRQEISENFHEKVEPLLDDIQKITDAWALQEKPIQNLITDYQELAREAVEATKVIQEETRKQEQSQRTVAPNVGNDSNYGNGSSGSNGNFGSESNIPTPVKWHVYANVDGQPEMFLNKTFTDKSSAEEALKPYKTLKDDKTIPKGVVHGYLEEIDSDGQKKTIASLLTGGYTGSWGPDGKIAMLHEKELVLNADDTKNFLAGISILRDIVSVIDLQAMNAAAASTIAAPSINIPSSSLNQNVTIAAEFPNVSNHLEIEEAFNNLVNRASQYANRI